MKRYYRELAASGEMLTGVILQLPSEALAEILAHAGVDVIILDTEHSPTGYEKLVSLIRACETFGALAFVRVPSARDEAAIKRALDAGAGGIMIPNVDTAEDARRAVEYAKFPPLGRRGACPFVRANAYGGEDRTDFYAKANAETAIILLVESPEGIRNLPEIVKVEGADMLQIGTVDLAVAMGLPGQTEHPEIMEALHRTAALCAEHGRHMAWYCGDAVSAAALRETPGVGMLVLPFPEIAIHDYYAALNRMMKGEQKAP